MAPPGGVPEKMRHEESNGIIYENQEDSNMTSVDQPLQP